MLKILICECNEINCAQLVSELYGTYFVRHVFTTAEVENSIMEFSPDVILCGREFGGLYVSDFSRMIRRFTKAPIILIRNVERLSPLPIKSFGMDDFICAPIRLNELNARITLALSEPPAPIMNNDSENTFRNGSMFIDYITCRVFINNEQVHLTLLEYKLLCLLSKNCGSVVKYGTILNDLWANPIGNEILSLRVFVTALRRKLQSVAPDENYLQTHMGEGYCMPKIGRGEN